MKLGRPDQLLDININVQGEPGANQSISFTDVNQGTKAFEKKYQDKTRNKWADRANFNPVPGKYTLIEVDQSADVEEDVKKVTCLTDCL